MSVIPASSAASREFYLAYLNSPAWRATRNRALRLANWTCQQCGGKRDLQVHHRSYERLGREWDQDLEVVCDDCHREVHIERNAACQAQRSVPATAPRSGSDAARAGDAAGDRGL